MSNPDPTPAPRMLRRANLCSELKTLKTPSLLFDEFWREGELAMLFGEANAGKSLLAAQIADALARGCAIAGFEMPGVRRNVLYIDLVLSDEQWAMRYSRATRSGTRRGYKFSQQLFRDRPAEGVPLVDWLRDVVGTQKISVVVIDDLSVVSQSDDGTRETLELVRELRRVTRELGISVLVLADSHRWVLSRGITERDLRRNRVLCAFADSVFAIESENGTDRRSLVQTRTQAGEAVWTSRNPARLNLVARDDGFVGFELEGPTPDQRATIVRIKEMHDHGQSFRAIADVLEMSKSTVARLHAKWTPKLEDEQEAGDAGVEEDLPGCEEYDTALSDPRFAGLYDDNGEWIEQTTYEGRLLDHEYELIGDARFHAQVVYEDTGITPRLADDKKYKEFLECVAAGGDPLDDPAVSSARPPAEKSVAGIAELSLPAKSTERSLDPYGREIFVETRCSRTGRPLVWYSHDRKGAKHRHERRNRTVFISAAFKEGRGGEVDRPEG